ncbi:DUF302 domain-containing protein [Hyphomicrobium sp.]|uniref:DUF302 domain-containing protein n=1 Tax=Hyphomicrobium sp. TaxID=82 RepID=UPI0026C28EFF
MLVRSGIFSALIVSLLLALPPMSYSASSSDGAPDNGIIKVKSVYSFGETVARLKADISSKGIMFFSAIDQSQLGAGAGITLNPSTLLIFGNPPLGIQFLTSNPDSGLDWPVRLLVRKDRDGQVWAVYTDFGWIARRHGISDRDAQFKMASAVIASITSSVASKR